MGSAHAAGIGYRSRRDPSFFFFFARGLLTAGASRLVLDNHRASSCQAQQAVGRRPTAFRDESGIHQDGMLGKNCAGQRDHDAESVGLTEPHWWMGQACFGAAAASHRTQGMGLRGWGANARGGFAAQGTRADRKKGTYSDDDIVAAG